MGYVFQHVDSFWSRSFAAAGQPYFTPTLQVIDAPLQTDCGMSQPYEGPSYCSFDRVLIRPLPYLVGFTFDEPGDFSLAYVIAHEMGHHVQNMAGLATAYQAALLEVSSTVDEVEAAEAKRQLTTGNELQADCLAGVWANAAYQGRLLQPGDVEEASQLAWDLGSDPSDHSATANHGTHEQRAEWFMYGYNGGMGSECKTYGGNVEATSAEASRNLVRLIRFFGYVGSAPCEPEPIGPESTILAGLKCDPTHTSTGIQLIDSWFYFFTGSAVPQPWPWARSRAGRARAPWRSPQCGAEFLMS